MSALVNLELVAALRRPVSGLPESVGSLQVPGLEPNTGWRKGLEGVDVVIHMAARVHVMHDTLSDPLAEFRKVNVGGTLNLAEQAAAAGVRRFIFISSIKVNGEGTSVRADVQSAPVDSYGISKMELSRGYVHSRPKPEWRW